MSSNICGFLINQDMLSEVGLAEHFRASISSGQTTATALSKSSKIYSPELLDSSRAIL